MSSSNSFIGAKKGIRILLFTACIISIYSHRR